MSKIAFLTLVLMVPHKCMPNMICGSFLYIITGQPETSACAWGPRRKRSCLDTVDGRDFSHVASDSVAYNQYPVRKINCHLPYNPADHVRHYFFGEFCCPF